MKLFTRGDWLIPISSFIDYFNRLMLNLLPPSISREHR